MKTSFRKTWLLGVASAAICLGAAPGAFADTLKGQVTDASGQAPMQGAIVTIEGLNRQTTSDRFGAYTFVNVPAGQYDVSVSYIGASPARQTVNIADETVANFAIGDAVAYRESIIVVGQAAAQAGAINQQRASNAIISVIDSDGLGNLPDTTVADSLQRLPGLSIENDQGEGRYVSIRGINTDLISSSINGVRTPSPEDRRGVLLDGVPSDLLDGIEVQKSLTPNLDADSIGGVINMKTISAFDRKGQFVRAKIEGSYNEITEEVSPKGTLTYSNVFGDRVGVAASVNYQDLRIEAHNNETGGWRIEDDGTPVLDDDYEMRWYDLTRKRLGLVLNFDVKATENTDLYLRTLYNRYTDDEVRNLREFRDLAAEGFDLNGSVYSFNFAEMDQAVRVREEVRNIQTYAFGGNTDLGALDLAYEVSYAFAQEDDSNNHDTTFRSGDTEQDGILLFDVSNPKQPLISGPGMADLTDPDNFELDSFEREYTNNEDTEWAAKFDVSYDSLIGNMPVVWAGGVKLRDREKVRDANIDVFEAVDDISMSDYIASTSPLSGWRMRNAMYAWPDADLTKALRGSSLLELNDEDTAIESLSGDYKIEEQILAAYGMGTFEIGDLTVVAGVRIEQTKTDSVGSIFTEGDDAATQRSFSDDYTNVLPSVNLKYAFTPELIARAAYYAAVVRPAFGDMAPVVLFNEDRDEIEMGNPALKPFEADNFDLALEYYPTKLSVLSAGFFHKKIKDAVFPATFDIDDLPSSVDLSFLADSVVAGLSEVSTYINVGDAEITGVEFNYVQSLDFLPGLLDGFLVSANLTLSDSEATLPDGRKVPMLKQNDTVWNAAIGYDKGPWDIRVSANFRGGYLDELFDENVDRYTDEFMSVEASVKYDVNDHLQVYVEGKNLNDRPEYYYHGDSSRLSQYDEYGWRANIGARLTY